MRWLAKAALQRTLGLLPQGERLNYVFQRHVLHSFPIGDASLRQKFTRAANHLAVYEEQGGGVPAAEATFFEFGAGWDLAIPLAYGLLGVGRQIVVDIRPSARLELVNDTIAAYERLRPELEKAAGRSLRDPGGPVASLVDLEPRFGIRYLAPCDARATGLPAGSVDFVSSTDTCEHIPAADLAAIFAECRRLLRPGGALSCRVDLQDHYAYFDPSLSRYNFLRFSDRTWALVNSPLHFQNRLRAPEYLSLVRGAGLDVVTENPSGPSEDGRAQLQALPLAERFRGYSVDELGVTILSFVARVPEEGSTTGSD
ncbi:MAG TPA: class I SAM-dependent methyltransferase [Gaiellaceae bacterium]|nr:class I SAM-dependent methyltransferase [Gaiellaceae bacterium]